jgi:probable HAF family extracellular repeat protein
MIRHSVLIPILILAFTVQVLSAQPAGVSYPLSEFSGGYLISIPQGINDLGQIVGFATAFRGGNFGNFLYDLGVFRVLDPVRCLQPTDINNLGQIVGWLCSYTAQEEYRSFLYDQGAFTYFDAPFAGAVRTFANGINDQGTIVGRYTDGAGRSHGFIRNHGVFSSYDVPVPGSYDTSLEDINNHGQIIGTYIDSSGVQHSLLLQGGMLTDLGTQQGRIAGINDRGDIVGNGVGGGFVVEQGVLTLLEHHPAAGAGPPKINNRGQIVGSHFFPGDHTLGVTWNRTPPLQVEFNANSWVTFAPASATYRTLSDTTGCPAGFVGKFTFTALLKHKSTGPAMPGMTVHVQTLTNGNVLLDPENNSVLGGPGAVMRVPSADQYSDGLLSPGDAVNVPFVLCLKTPAGFQFAVDVYGIITP